MKRVLIGHRGVGKSSLLKRHAKYFPEFKHFDLDYEIEKSAGMTVEKYFQKHAESSFREKEQEVFKKIISENCDYVISLGAGFDLSALPTDIETLYVSRLTDKDGRIFLNRPRLNEKLRPLEEYKEIYNIRNSKYLKSAQHIYHMPEGLELESDIEKKILSRTFEVRDAYYTLTTCDLRSVESVIGCYKKIELRTDLLSREIIQNLLQRFPENDWLLSIRTADRFDFKYIKNIDVDYQYYYKGCQIASSHADQIDVGIHQLSQITEKVHLKLCPLVENFDDLIKGFRWQQQDSEKRSFLPRSTTEKWTWYRQLSKYWQKLNFLRNLTNHGDQPSPAEWLILPAERPTSWGAVLGLPIYFSRSPAEHQKYFSERNSFFTKIEIGPEDFEENIKFIIDLGLKFAAITSPLKDLAFKIADHQTEVAQALKSANTLFIEADRISCHNTDQAGFKELVKNIEPKDQVAIWGGGGTLAMMKSILPKAHLFSAQAGQPRDSSLLVVKTYDYLIWAAPKSHRSVWPEEALEIKAVIDLNYSENSMGLEFAAFRKIRYISGVEMFKLQALKQQEFWGAYERK